MQASKTGLQVTCPPGARAEGKLPKNQTLQRCTEEAFILFTSASKVQAHENGVMSNFTCLLG
jgi:hypothetical protein